MSDDTLPTVWDAEPHTLAKHGIFRSYLEAWAAILSNASFAASELLLVDGFAGPGEYATGEPGSPVVALSAILDHSRTLPKPVRCVFIEKDVKRHQHLCARLARDHARTSASSRVIVDDPIRGDCEFEIRKLIAKRKADRKPLGPALFFLDQFGYSQISMSLLKEIMSNGQCEVFSYLNCQRLSPYIADSTKAAAITDAYGDESWRAAIALEGDARQQCLITTYMEAIRKNAWVEFVWSFAMFDTGAHLLHWLVFSTNSLSGLENMKKAMWAADKGGTYHFSDRVDPRQQVFFSTLDDEWLAAELSKQLMGEVLDEDQLKEFVLTRTPFYRYKAVMQLLRKTDRVSSVNQGQKWPIRFVKATQPVATVKPKALSLFDV